MLIIMEPKGEREEMNRTTTKLPGFTAEASLFTSSGNYGSEGRYMYTARNKIVVLQRMGPADCFRACINAGYPPEICYESCPHATK
jgi:hypothetical protein